MHDRVVVVDDFLSTGECERALEELDFALWRPSLTYTRQPDGSRKNELTRFRVSETAHQFWFTRDLNVFIADVEHRLGRLVALEPANLETWQATRYALGGKFEYHLDSGYWTEHYAGERRLSVVVYLETPQAGGGTDFRALDLYVHARAGRLLLWENLFADGHADHRMIHASAPVRSGSKTTLVTWLRQERFRL